MRAKSGLDKLAEEQGQLLPAIADEEMPEPQGENVVNYHSHLRPRMGHRASRQADRHQDLDHAGVNLAGDQKPFS